MRLLFGDSTDQLNTKNSTRGLPPRSPRYAGGAILLDCGVFDLRTPSTADAEGEQPQPIAQQRTPELPASTAAVACSVFAQPKLVAGVRVQLLDPELAVESLPAVRVQVSDYQLGDNFGWRDVGEPLELSTGALEVLSQCCCSARLRVLLQTHWEPAICGSLWRLVAADHTAGSEMPARVTHWQAADAVPHEESVEFARTGSFVRSQRLRSLAGTGLDAGVRAALLEVLDKHEKRSRLVIMEAARERLRR